ncbi:MAG: agmatine deiminase [Gammaproteobacteria bacterium]|nr:MAG: agmatine deiminase [Gammaproteobacteria bacterium]
MPRPCVLPEWAPQDAVLLAWPHPDSDWGPLWPQIENDFLRLARLIAAHEPLLVLVRDAAHRRHLGRRLWHDRVFVCEVPTDDTWCRDFGPLAVAGDGGPTLVDFRFNAWGGRYPWAQDDAATARLAALGAFAAPLRRADMVLEGGSLDSDGAGTLLTTRRCQLDGRRNPALAGDPAAFAEALGRHLPFERLIWLESGLLEGDDTDAHVDNLARFTDPRTLVYAASLDPDDPHHEPLTKLAEELAALRTADGRPYRLVPLPLPAARHSRVDGRRLPASYVNFLVINGAVLVPQFGDRLTDHLALSRLAGCFPGRRVIGVDSRGFIEQNGGIHCLTMQLPAGSVAWERLRR